MSKSQALDSSGFFDAHASGLFQEWEAEIRDNPRFQAARFSQEDAALDQSKTLFHSLLHSADELKVPEFSESVEPVFKLWRELQSQLSESGMNSKDSALLLYSFKSSLLRYLRSLYENGDYEHEPSVSQLRNLLDFLGLLTFESYSQENEALLGRRDTQIQYLQTERGDQRFGDIIGDSPAMAQVFAAIDPALRTGISVLLLGETGTGKDLIAHAIHQHSNRRQGPFITLNCGAVPKDLMESELFGHEKGAFTGALERRLGKFELADGGTLFLDEVGEMPLDLQVKLLRVLQNKEIERVGGQAAVPVDVRIIAATHRDLSEMVDEGSFRSDLFYRLNVYPIQIPSLAERKDDIAALAEFFLQRYAEDFGLDLAQLSEEALQALKQRTWQGNVRELENLMQRMAVLLPGAVIRASHLQYEPGSAALMLDSGVADGSGLGFAALRDEQDASGRGTSPSEEAMPSVFDGNGTLRRIEEVEADMLGYAIKKTKGNVSKASGLLGISRTTFYKKAKDYGVDV